MSEIYSDKVAKNRVDKGEKYAKIPVTELKFLKKS
jgi:hypothetical protein